MLKFNFCTLQKYYPTKLVPQNTWKKSYLPIYQQRAFNQDEIEIQNAKRLINALPSLLYTGYWAFLGSLNLPHVLGFAFLFGLYAKARYSDIMIDIMMPKQIYMNENGLDWVFICKTLEKKEQSQDLRDIFQYSDDQQAIQFKVDQVKVLKWDIMSDKYELARIIVNDSDPIKKKEENADYYLLEIDNKEFILNLTLNEHIGMIEYLKAMIGNKEIVLNK